MLGNGVGMQDCIITETRGELSRLALFLSLSFYQVMALRPTKESTDTPHLFTSRHSTLTMAFIENNNDAEDTAHVLALVSSTPMRHVCQKWRSVVFGSPRRLNLRLLCTKRTPVREMLAG